MPKMTTPSEAPRNQRERLWQIDFLARFRGQVTRQDLVQRFGIALSNATRDLSTYRDLAPQNLDYDHSERVYRRTRQFQPLFSYDREHTLQTLTLGQAIGFEACDQPILVNAAPSLNQPDLDILATVSRAIYAAVPMRIDYVSLSSGETTREIVPHSLVNTGLRWHARAFCRTHEEFRDFVLTRITAAEELGGAVDTREQVVEDRQWNQEVVLELAPHPRSVYPRAIELDYGLAPGEILQCIVRAATAGYLLRRWGVDCSPGAVLPPEQYHLALQNLKSVSEQASLSIAPGFSSEKEH